jgi:hypothetical protein
MVTVTLYHPARSVRGLWLLAYLLRLSFIFYRLSFALYIRDCALYLIAGIVFGSFRVIPLEFDEGWSLLHMAVSSEPLIQPYALRLLVDLMCEVDSSSR